MSRAKPDDGLRPIFKSHLELLGFHMQSVETGGTGQGIPDTNFCVNDPAHCPPIGRTFSGIEGWVEYKSTSGWTVDLRPEQIGWIERRVRVGGRVLIAVRRRHGGGPRLGRPVDELHLLPGRVARLARIGGLRAPEVLEAALGRWCGGPSRWDWDRVAEALIA